MSSLGLSAPQIRICLCEAGGRVALVAPMSRRVLVPYTEGLTEDMSSQDLVPAMAVEAQDRALGS